MSAFQRNIQHVVVLMLENRSFDHMLGFFGTPNGLTGTEFNVLDPANPGQRIVVSKDASPTADLVVDPAHGLEDINVQLFGSAVEPTPPPATTNHGFVLNYSQQPGVTPATAGNVMKCFDTGALPALTALAREFAICDQWFSSVPSQTWPNRFFVHAATSMGHIDNRPRVYTARTIYDNLTRAAEDWAIYFHDIPQSLMLANLRKSKYRSNFKVFAERFRLDCETGLLPTYSFIEPRYFDFLSFKANDQHPPHDVSLGDVLIAEVYESLRLSPVWDSSLLVVTWDEHGGIYDHQLPLATVNPDGLVHTNPGFDFTRLGLRVPAVIASPYIPRGTVDSTVYDHTSVPASLKELLDLPEFLTRRDAAANTFGHLITDTKRTDTPETLPRASVVTPPAATTASLDNVDVRRELDSRSTAPLSEFQESLVELSRTLPQPDNDRLRVARAATVPIDEHSAAVYVREAVELFRRS